MPDDAINLTTTESTPRDSRKVKAVAESGVRAESGQRDAAPSELMAPKSHSPARPPTAQLIPKLPQKERRGFPWALLSFIVCVVLPIVMSVIYFTFFAAPQYASEFRFSVTDASNSTSSSSSAASGASALLSMVGAGGSTSSSTNYIVTQYLKSAQAIADLRKKIDLTALFAKPDFDWWYRFNPSLPIERFVDYWQNMVSAQYDQITGIATVSVRAFTPEDAHLIATSMVDLSEDLVNRLQGRMLKDGLKTSEAEVTKAEERLAAVQKKIAQFRKEYGVIDPNASIVASNAGLAQTLRATLSQQQLSLDVIVAQTSNPNAPVVQNLKSQIKAIRDQIAAIENSVTTDSNVSGGRSVASAAALSTIVGQYEPLDVERQLAIASLASSKQALDMARASAAAQHLYLTPFVQPNIPQSSIYPKRILSVVFCSFIAFVVWILLFLVARSIREHFR